MRHQCYNKLLITKNISVSDVTLLILTLLHLFILILALHQETLILHIQHYLSIFCCLNHVCICHSVILS